MSGLEYLLAALVILVPLAIAVVVTGWTLEQARLRSKKNRRPQGQAVDLLAPDAAPDVDPWSATGSSNETTETRTS